MKRARVLWLLACAWALMIFGVSSIPGRSLPDMALLTHDKALHMALYVPLGFFCALALRSGRRWGVLRLVGTAAVLAGGYGLTDEFHQLFVPGRSSDLEDALADLAGGAVGAALGLVSSAWGPLRPFASGDQAP